MKKLPAFVLIEICMGLLVLGVMLSVSFSLFSTSQKHLKWNVTEERIKLIQSSLVGYYHTRQKFPVPDNIKGTGGGLQKGSVPVKALGLPEETQKDGWGNFFTYTVDERFVNQPDALKTIKDNRIRIYDVPTDPIPFLLESKNKKVFLTSSTILHHYLPNDAKRPEGNLSQQNQSGAPPLVLPNW